MKYLICIEEYIVYIHVHIHTYKNICIVYRVKMKILTTSLMGHFSTFEALCIPLYDPPRGLPFPHPSREKYSENSVNRSFQFSRSVVSDSLRPHGL